MLIYQVLWKLKNQKFDKYGKKVYNRKVSFFRKGVTDIL